MNEKPSEAEALRRMAPVVEYYAKKLARQRRGVPDSLCEDDLVQEGFLGVLDALDRFDANGGAQFSTFARSRAWGAMRDAIRRYVRTHARGGQTLCNRVPIDPEKTNPAHKDRLEQVLIRWDDETATDPDEFASTLRRLCGRLTEREQRVAVEYFARGKTLATVGREVGVSESFTCWMVKNLARRIRDRMDEEGWSEQDVAAELCHHQREG